MNTINIARDYTRFPGGRYTADGKGNGQDFREQYLLPVLKAGDRAVIDLDGAVGYPSSFLEEAFAGLVRVHGYTFAAIQAAFDLRATQAGLRQFVPMVWKYVRQADEKKSSQSA